MMAEQPAHLLTGNVWCKYHCASCDECFRSLAAFDAHRRGSHYKNTRHCADPEGLTRLVDGEPLLEALEGRCKRTNSPGVWESTVWRLAGSGDDDS